LEVEVALVDIESLFLILRQVVSLFPHKLIQLPLALEAQVKALPQVVMMVLIQFFLQLHPQGEEVEVFPHLRVEAIRVDQEVEE
jgi:hypothetical protein